MVAGDSDAKVPMGEGLLSTTCEMDGLVADDRDTKLDILRGEVYTLSQKKKTPVERAGMGRAETVPERRATARARGSTVARPHA